MIKSEFNSEMNFLFSSLPKDIRTAILNLIPPAQIVGDLYYISKDFQILVKEYISEQRNKNRAWFDANLSKLALSNATHWNFITHIAEYYFTLSTRLHDKHRKLVWERGINENVIDYTFFLPGNFLDRDRTSGILFFRVSPNPFTSLWSLSIGGVPLSFPNLNKSHVQLFIEFTHRKNFLFTTKVNPFHMRIGSDRIIYSPEPINYIDVELRHYFKSATSYRDRCLQVWKVIKEQLIESTEKETAWMMRDKNAPIKKARDHQGNAVPMPKDEQQKELKATLKNIETAVKAIKGNYVQEFEFLHRLRIPDSWLAELEQLLQSGGMATKIIRVEQ